MKVKGYLVVERESLEISESLVACFRSKDEAELFLNDYSKREGYQYLDGGSSLIICELDFSLDLNKGIGFILQESNDA